MAGTTPDGSIPPVEPPPTAAPAPPPPPAPRAVDPYAPVAPPAPPGYGAPAYAPTYQAGYYGAPQPPVGLSIASMVLGIAGVVFSLVYGFGLFPSIAAIITGHLARRRQPYARGYSLAGLICGYVGAGVSMLWIVALIGIIIWGVTAGASGSYSTY